MPIRSLSSLRRSILCSFATFLATATALHASPITYQMTFTSGSNTGTGTLTLASTPAASGVTSYTVSNQQIQDLIFTVGDQTYNFSTDPSASVQFVDGQISQINFGQALSQTPSGYTLELSNGFVLYGSNVAQPLFSGSYSVTPSFVPDDTGSTEPATTNPTPEPGSLLLLATALLGGGFLIFRRARHTQS